MKVLTQPAAQLRHTIQRVKEARAAHAWKQTPETEDRLDNLLDQLDGDINALLDDGGEIHMSRADEAERIKRAKELLAEGAANQ